MGLGQVKEETILRNHYTRLFVPGMYPEDTVGHLISCAEGHRRVGIINSRGHLIANRLQNRILHPPEVSSIAIP